MERKGFTNGEGGGKFDRGWARIFADGEMDMMDMMDMMDGKDGIKVGEVVLLV